MDAKVGLFGLGEDLENFPTRSAAVDAAVCEGFGEDDVNDLEDCVREIMLKSERGALRKYNLFPKQ